jgi:hypothetical protein
VGVGQGECPSYYSGSDECWEETKGAGIEEDAYIEMRIKRQGEVI